MISLARQAYKGFRRRRPVLLVPRIDLLGSPAVMNLVTAVHFACFCVSYMSSFLDKRRDTRVLGYEN